MSSLPWYAWVGIVLGVILVLFILYKILFTQPDMRSDSRESRAGGWFRMLSDFFWFWD